MARIEFINVGLVYPVRENHSITIKEYLLQSFFLRKLSEKRKYVQALNDINFRVGDRERLGIIGPNGAGKSTLLRAIAGIYPITRGQRRIEGGICSLFDIGAGFEPEAKGWENIRFRFYLQGETPATIKDKIVEVAEFTELGEFLDLPLGCYSTGMRMRLAFAIATASEREILLIDEVFSTGDLAFQNKAEARMRELMNKARIVVMVGHDLEFLQQFCTRILWLDHGHFVADGPPQEIVQRYRESVNCRDKAA